MKSWHVLLLGMVAGVACVIVAKKLLSPKNGGVGGLGGDAAIPPPHPSWYNLPYQPMEYKYTGWNPPAAYKAESEKLRARRVARSGRGMGQFETAQYPASIFPYPQYPAYPQTYVVEEPINWRSPTISERYFGDQDDPF